MNFHTHLLVSYDFQFFLHLKSDVTVPISSRKSNDATRSWIKERLLTLLLDRIKKLMGKICVAVFDDMWKNKSKFFVMIKMYFYTVIISFDYFFSFVSYEQLNTTFQPLILKKNWIFYDSSLKNCLLNGLNHLTWNMVKKSFHFASQIHLTLLLM